jgi:hypothetical protein
MKCLQTCWQLVPPCLVSCPGNESACASVVVFCTLALGHGHGTLQSKRYRTWQPLAAIVALPSVIPAVKFPSSHVPFPASKNVPPEFVLLLKACIGTRAWCFATTTQVIQRDSLQPPLLSTCWHIFRPEWTSPMTAPIGRSVHRMGCVFHLPLYLTLTNILLQSIFFGFWPLTIFYFFYLFLNFHLHTTLPPSYPTDLQFRPAYELTTHPLPSFYLLAKHILILD